MTISLETATTRKCKLINIKKISKTYTNSRSLAYLGVPPRVVCQFSLIKTNIVSLFDKFISSKQSQDPVVLEKGYALIFQSPAKYTTKG